MTTNSTEPQINTQIQINSQTPNDLTQQEPQINTQIQIENNVTQQKSLTYSNRVLKSLNDAKTAKYCNILFYALLIIAGFSVLIYQTDQYLDEDVNSITRSEIVTLQDGTMSFPYFFFHKATWESGQLLAVKLPDDTVIESNDIKHIDYEDFKSHEQITDWTWINHDDSALIIPPYGTKLAVDKSIGLLIVSWHESSIYVNEIESHQDHVLYDFSNGVENGIFWKAGNVKHLKDPDKYIYGNLSSGNYSNFEQLQYTLAGTINFVQVDSFKAINNIDSSKNDVYYEMTEKATILSQEFTILDSTSNYYYLTVFYFYVNPVGGGVETILTTDRLFGWFDILSRTGGVFSPFKDGMLMFLGWMLFGVGCCAGIASKKALDEEEKRQIRIYLEEVGLLDEKKLGKIERKNTEKK
eukprot:454263_1